MRLSVIIPVLNEACQLEALLQSLQPLRQRGGELIVVDGGSCDQSFSIAQTWADQILLSKQGRAIQMNVGAAVAQGNVLLFLHADTRLPASAISNIAHARLNCLFPALFWGRFDVQLSGRQWVYRIIESMMNLRSRLTAIATGDQAIFIDTALFHRLGGYPEIELMEDIALCRILRKQAQPVCLSARVQTSSRRWEQYGVVKTVLLMWTLRLLYRLGISPSLLVKMYK